MATKKKATSRLSKAEKEVLARRATGQLKRKATLEAKKKAEAKPVKQVEREMSSSKVEVAQPILVLDPSATTQFLKEQLSKTNDYNIGLPTCGGAEVAQSAPSVSALVKLHDRLEQVLSRYQYTHSQLLNFQERLGGSVYAFGDQKVEGATAGAPAPSGIIFAIDMLLDQIDAIGNKHVDAVHKLDRLG